MIDDINILYTKYNISFVIIYFILTTIIRYLFFINIEIEWIINLFGSIFGYLLHDIVIKKHVKNHNKYIKNLIKWSLILISQNIFYGYHFKESPFQINSILKISYYLLFYLLFYRLTDEIIDEKHKDKEMYSDIIRIPLTYIIVKSLFNDEITKKDFIFILSIVVALYIYYQYFDIKVINYLKKVRKEYKKKFIK
jgi:hypothetical protein